MKKLLLLLILSLPVSVIISQNYQIDFAGMGGTSVDSVHVINQVQNTSISLMGGDVLHLLGSVGIISPKKEMNPLMIFPNPVSEKTTISFYTQKEGNTYIEMIDVSGKTKHLFSKILQRGLHHFHLTGLANGIYYLKATTPDLQYTAKVVSICQSNADIKIKHIKTEQIPYNDYVLKSSKATVPMQYNDGELLQFTAFSGTMANVSTLIPTQSQTITFSFTPCTDAEGNNYASVVIGTQTWMSENLKTTQFNDGSPIPHVTGNSDWVALTTPGYCWPQNDINNKEPYGAFYNWYTVDTLSNGNKNPCPVGWHVPDSTEWGILVNFAGDPEWESGCRLKATGNLTDSTGFWLSPNLCATNDFGFSAQGANTRSSSSGSFMPIGVSGYYVGSNNLGSYGCASAYFNYNQPYVRLNNYGEKKNAFSIRCIKD